MGISDMAFKFQLSQYKLIVNNLSSFTIKDETVRFEEDIPDTCEELIIDIPSLISADSRLMRIFNLDRLKNLKKLYFLIGPDLVHKLTLFQDFNEICNITTLTHLVIKKHFEHIIPDLKKLTNLKVLNLDFEIEKLDSLSEITSLEELTINSVEEIGDSLKGLNSLKKLIISNHAGKDVKFYEDAIEKSGLTGLEELLLSNVNFEHTIVPGKIDFSKLISLKKLVLLSPKKFNKETLLPNESLEHFEMKGTGSQLILNSFIDTNFPKLKVFIYEAIGYDTIHSNIFNGSMTAPLLEVVSFIKNDLIYNGAWGDMIDKPLIIFNISNFPNLVSLDLNKSYIDQIKYTIDEGHVGRDGPHDRLTYLNISSYQINRFEFTDDLPSPDYHYLSKLIELKKLNLSDNGFRTFRIDDSDDGILDNLVNLEELNIRKNIFEGSHEELIKLNLYGNEMTELPNLLNDFYSPNLEILNVNINKLTENSLRELDDRLDKLYKISVNNNNIEKLPIELFDMKLSDLSIGDNPFTLGDNASELYECLYNSLPFPSALRYDAYFRDARFNYHAPSNFRELKECLFNKKEVDLTVCEDDYINIIMDTNVVNFSNNFVSHPVYTTKYELESHLLQPPKDFNVTEIFISFIKYFWTLTAFGVDSFVDWRSLFNFNFIIRGGVAIDMGGPLKDFYDNIFNKKLKMNDTFTLDERNTIDTKIKDIHIITLFAIMIGGYRRGLSNFNSNFSFTHTLSLVYRYRHDYLDSKNNKEKLILTLKKFAVNFLHENLEEVTSMDKTSNKLHVYAFLLAEFIDSNQVFESR